MTTSPKARRVLDLRRLGRVCPAIAGPSVEELLARSASLLPEFPFQELRLDHLRQPAEALPPLCDYLSHNPFAIVVATCRPVASGGKLVGSPQEELSVLEGAAEAGCQIVDLSLESAEALGSSALEALRQRGALVQISFHDFEQTGDLGAALQRLLAFGPDLAKIIPTANTLDDSLALVALLRENRSGPVPLVGVAMGEVGTVTRILGPSSGSAYTFAAASDAEATAPGQLSARTLCDLYRIGRITPATRLFAVAGDPIRSSLSPLMHNQAFRHLEIDGAYLPLKTSSAQEALRAMRQLSLEGMSVTMPLKQAMMPLLTSVDALAARIGAVNTVVRQPDGSLYGCNTDAAGVTVPLERRINLTGRRVLVLGAGGAARAAAFGCADRGADLYVFNRTESRALALAHEVGGRAVQEAVLSSESFDVMVNATPAGMQGNTRALPISVEQLRADLVFDLVYNPLETPLLTQARRQGLEPISGVEMFVEQGVRQFELWTGQKAPGGLMREVVESALRTRQA